MNRSKRYLKPLMCSPRIDDRAEHLRGNARRHRGIDERAAGRTYSLRKGLHRDMLEHPPEDLDGFLQTAVPYATEVERMTLARAPLVSYARSTRGGQAFGSLWSEIQARLAWQAPKGKI